MTCRTSKAPRKNVSICAATVAKQTQWPSSSTLTRTSQQPWPIKKLKSLIFWVPTKKWRCSKIDTKILSRKEESQFKVRLKIATMASWFTRTMIRRPIRGALTSEAGRLQWLKWLTAPTNWPTLLGHEASYLRPMLSLACPPKQLNSLTTSPWVVTLKENWATT